MKTRLSGFPVFLPDEPQDQSELHELFHENTKLRPGIVPESPKRPLPPPQPRSTRLRFPNAPITPLPPPEAAPWREVSWMDLVSRRRTNRNFKPSSLGMESISAMLHCAYRSITRHQPSDLSHTRPSPSAGALYPLEVYVAINHSDTSGFGLYHYDADRHRIARLSDDLPSGILQEICLDGAALHDAALVLIVTARFGYTTSKYGDRGYRYVLLEAGHVAQTVMLTATALGLASFPVGGFIDDRVNEWLGVDGVNEATCYMIGVGESA